MRQLGTNLQETEYSPREQSPSAIAFTQISFDIDKHLKYSLEGFFQPFITKAASQRRLVWKCREAGTPHHRGNKNGLCIQISKSGLT